MRLEPVPTDALSERHLGFVAVDTDAFDGVRVFQLTSEGHWQRAALPALAIVLAGLVPVLLLNRRSA